MFVFFICNAVALQLLGDSMQAALLPLEVRGSILSFLCLDDVLALASTSSSAMRDALPDLQRRRNNMKKPFAYCAAWKTQSKAESFGLWDVMTARHPTMAWIKVPSVQDRVSELRTRIPSGHPMRGVISCMSEDLIRDISLDGVNVAGMSSADVFALYQQLLRVQKMHATILHYVMHSNPMEKESVVDLDRYVGDVLCVAYLINQSTLDLVDGELSDGAIFRDAHPPTSQKPCYLSWVYLHSSILRVKAFTAAQRHRLGIPEFSGLSETIVPNDKYVNESFLSSEMTLVFREFGPLGPAFRGRDIVRLREIPARGLFAYMISNDTREAGDGAVSAWEWLCEVHEQSRKVRPMTVRPPQVRLAVPT